MLALSPNNRRKASDIYNELYPHEDEILNIEPFQEKVDSAQVRPPPVQHGYPQNQAGSYVFQVQPQIPRVTYQPPVVQGNYIKYQPQPY